MCDFIEMMSRKGKFIATERLVVVRAWREEGMRSEC